MRITFICRQFPISVVDFVRVFRQYTKQTVAELKVLFDTLKREQQMTINIDDATGLAEASASIGIYLELIHQEDKDAEKEQGEGCHNTLSDQIEQLKTENQRLRELVKKAYFEADSTYWPDSNWNASKSKATLEGKDE